MKNSWLITVSLVAIVFIGGGVIAIYMIQGDLEKQKAQPKVFNPGELNRELVDSSLHYVNKGHKIDHFQLLDQNGDTVTMKDLKKKIYVTDFFFTTCQTICPKMTNQLERVHQEFKDEDRFLIVSHTVWPEQDSVPVMRRYADMHGADDEKWWFLTGEKDVIYDLARRSYFTLRPAEVGEDGDGNSAFIHTNLFVLVDAKRRIRGYYDGTNKKEVDKLMEDVRYLLENE